MLKGSFQVAVALSFVLALAASVRPRQETISVSVQTPDGPLDPGLSIVNGHGFAAVPAGELARMGWIVEESGGSLVALWPGGLPRVEIEAGTPFLSWGGDGVHLAEAPYVESGRLFLPLQFFIDILPWKLPEVFRYDPDARTLIVGGRSGSSGRFADPIRVVVIDPGHGGRDPGAKGVRGTREKDIALAIGRTLAGNLRDDPNLEVYLTRTTDTLIPIWKRGELATEWRGEHPGVFVSIHANAMPNSRGTRGFETYFLSEARTEHERRVTALENAAQEFETADEGPADTSDLSFILAELRNLDHQHWSALLAEMIQDRLDQVHPGPNRGVKQGPLAVITNALMPAVLVEVGFVTNPEEERLLNQGTFQERAATAVAAAVRDFFRRYPGGGSTPRDGSEES
jgi:N-acetylmuramoyl-L-alanine amidase